MITPAYSLTATERALPRLALDFTTAVLDPRVTVTRALNTATRTNSSGFIEIVNANLPRFDFSPTSIGTCRGLLIEETRANRVLQSANFTTASWTKTDTTLTTAAGTAPDGTNSATLLTQGALATSELSQSFSITAGSTVTYSSYIKLGNARWYLHQIRNAGNTSFANAFFDLTNGVVGSTSTTGGFATLFGSSITNVGNGWYRATFTVMIGATFGTAVFSTASVTADNTLTRVNGGTRLEWGLQAETGTFATSYIPTTTASLTRNADVVTMTGTNFSSWYSTSTAAMAAVVTPIAAAGVRPVWQFDDTTANEIIALRGNAANPELYIVDNGAVQAQLDAGTITAGTRYGLCGAFTTNSCAVSQNGATPATTATATMPTVTQARIGSDGTNFLNGTVQSLRYWPQRLLNAETQAFSK